MDITLTSIHHSKAYTEGFSVPASPTYIAVGNCQSIKAKKINLITTSCSL